MANKKQRKSPKQRSLMARLRRQLVAWFVPHRRNHYRPHLINRYGLALVLLAGVIGYALQPQPNVLGDQPSISSGKLLTSVNEVRATENVQPLRLNQQLSNAATRKGKDMFTHQYWAHTSPSGVSPWQWIEDEHYTYAYAGENLARNFGTAPATVRAWMASPSHRTNMLHDYYTEAGFGVVSGQLDGKPTTIVVALFATPESSAAPAPSPGTTLGLTDSALGPFARFGVSIQAMNPAATGALFATLLGLLIATVSLYATHLHTRPVYARQPARRRQTQRFHHPGKITVKLLLLGATLAAYGLLYTGGQL